MKKLSYAIAAVAVVLAVGAALIYNTAAGQDLLLRQAVQTLMSQAPPALNGVLFTHFHSDHIADLADVNLASWVQGRKTSLEVYGPAGVDEVVDGFNQAYRLDRHYRVAHHGSDLLAPAAAPMTPVAFTPGEIAWQDGLMTITSFPVDHAPIAPAVGYRVDYRDRSVVISGDSNATGSLFAAARDAGLDWDQLQQASLGEDWESVLDDNLTAMLAAGLWGVPSFRVTGGADGNAFACWGQDRIWRLENEIARRA